MVETDMCAVDAIQSLTGCTFGKGNLIYRDLGKMAFTFHRRADDQGVRLLFNTDMLMGGGPEFMDLTRKWITGQATPEEKATIIRMREERSQRIMDSPLEEVFTVKEPLQAQPHKARLLDTLQCDRCGEGTMESRTPPPGGSHPVHLLLRGDREALSGPYALTRLGDANPAAEMFYFSWGAPAAPRNKTISAGDGS